MSNRNLHEQTFHQRGYGYGKQSFQVFKNETYTYRMIQPLHLAI